MGKIELSTQKYSEIKKLASKLDAELASIGNQLHSNEDALCHEALNMHSMDTRSIKSPSESSMPQLEEFFQRRIRVLDVNSNTCAISFPMYKITGGMYEIYLISKDGNFYLSDEGATIAELDKIFELGEPDVIKNLVAILRQYNCKKIGKNITVECTPKDVHIKFSYLVQAISFMLNMKIFYI